MHATALDEYWDALALAQDAPGAERPDGETADLIDRLWAFSAPPDPDLARERGWRRLQQHREREERGMDARPHVGVPNLAPRSPYHAGGRTAPRTEPGSGQAWWQSITGQLATAALLVLALAGSFVTFGPGRPGQGSTVISALNGPPAAPETDGVATTLLLDVVIPAISDDQGFVAIDRYTIPPATTLDLDMQGGHIPSIFLLVTGALDAHALDVREPVRVIRSGGANPEEAITRGESVALAAGDAIIVPEEGAATLMNLSVEPATVLFVLQPSDDLPPGSNAIPHQVLGGGARNLIAPLSVTLRQVTIDAGSTLPGADDPAAAQFVTPVDPDRIMDARTGSNGSLRNAGDEPLGAYVLTVTSGAPVP
jgi:hypothetical protein